MSESSPSAASGSLEAKRVALVGKLAGMSRRRAMQLVRQHGGSPVDSLDSSVDLIVIGEEEFPLDASDALAELLDDAARGAAESGAPRVISETQLWQELGFVEAEQNVHRLYTPRMLAELVQAPVAVIRRWHRRGLIVPVREVLKLPYFDFQEVATARRLAELLAAGVSPRAIESMLERLARYVPGVERPLAQLSVIVDGKDLLLRQGAGLVEPGGQRRFDFGAEAGPDEAAADDAPEERILSLDAAPLAAPLDTPQEMIDAAADLEERGHGAAAIEMYRAALAAGGPNPDVCFRLAELLFSVGDLSAARERYFMAIELDEDYVEARANLGCVLAELDEPDLAVAAFQGALTYYPDFPDAHFHLAQILDEQGRLDDAETHWRTFLELAADSPWAEAARQRLAGRSDL